MTAPNDPQGNVDGDTNPGGDTTADAAVEVSREDPGPGCLPIVMAVMVLSGILGALFCAGSTWWLFQQRTDFAIRTLAATEKAIEQSYLRPQVKTEILGQMRELSLEMQRGNYTNAESSAVMAQLVRLPLTQWGELNLIEAAIADVDENVFAEDAHRQLTRLRRAVETGDATNLDFEEVLRPASDFDAETQIRLVQESPSVESIRKVIEGARSIADRAKIPDRDFPDVSIEKIVRRNVEAGLNAAR